MSNEPQDLSAVPSKSEEASSVEPTPNAPEAAREEVTTSSESTEPQAAETASPEASPAGEVSADTPNETTAEQGLPSAEAPSAETPTSEGAAEASTGEPDEKKKIAIGTQRETESASGPVVPKQVARAGDGSSSRSTTPSGPVPVPSKRSSDASEEQELAAILGGSSVDQLVDQSVSDSDDELEVDTRLKGTVQRIHQDNVFFALKGRFEGVASVRQFKKPPEIGSLVEVVVKNFLPDEGLYEVAVPGAAASVADWSDVQPGTVVEVKITGSNTGGLECTVNNIRGFIPASQIDLHRVENFGDYVNQKMTCVVTEANKKRKNLVLSRRQLLEQTLAEERKEKLAQIEAGAEVDGKVTRLTDFGAFVAIGGGVEGLVHISKISWDRIDHPKDVLTVGQDIRVKIEKVNPESGKISLSYRDTIEHPWHNIDAKYAVGSTVRGTVSRLAQFGAFVKLEPGVEGLVHISELAHHRVVAVKNIVKEGDEIEVKVLSIEPEAQKMGLSLKATLPEPEKPTKANEEPEPDQHRPMAVRRQSGPLKGGKDKPSGGDRFGLKW